MTLHWTPDEAEVAGKGIGIAIELLRQELEISQEELAAEAEITTAALMAIEQGEVEASWSALRAVKNALGIDLGDLLKLAEGCAPSIDGGSGGWWSRQSREIDSTLRGLVSD